MSVKICNPKPLIGKTIFYQICENRILIVIAKKVVSYILGELGI